MQIVVKTTRFPKYHLRFCFFSGFYYLACSVSHAYRLFFASLPHFAGLSQPVISRQLFFLRVDHLPPIMSSLLQNSFSLLGLSRERRLLSFKIPSAPVHRPLDACVRTATRICRVNVVSFIVRGITG